MKKILSLVLIISSFTAVDAQRYKNPQQYLRQFSNENRKINKKALLYLEASIKGEEERRIERYHEMVVEQMKESRLAIGRVGDYNGDEVLKREYMAALEELVKIYENDFGIAEELRENQYRSYEDLKKYYDAVTDAEGKMYQESYRMEKAEDYFAKKNFIELTRDEEIIEQYVMLDEVTLYSRDMTLAFFRVQSEVKDFLQALEDGNLDTLGLCIAAIKPAIKESREEVEEYADFDGEDDLYKEVVRFLEDMEEEVNFNLIPMVENLKNKYLDEKEFRDTRKDLERFVERQNDRVEDYFETRKKLILEYLPED